MTKMKSLMLFIVLLPYTFVCVVSLPSSLKNKEGTVSLNREQDDHEHTVARFRRSLLQFYQMISCATNNDPLKYNFYGCYCGLGGKGTPVDALDRCCEKHDACYNQINQNKLCRFPWHIYTKSYDMEGCTGCASSNDKCQLAICNCDSVAAQCFARNKLNPAYEDYPQSKCK
ncbi:neutral phospholipase A2 3-like [Orbicella faveolata]|uniref:neutral phospholipase A2 3-like n=1 Tax=Orbicella faveolata TaxID=48498 RepID=UPI0009E28120|nr:neutral phospholipase A2 3-like [Orbicella faveolata]